MSSRFAKMHRPRPASSWGEAIAATIITVFMVAAFAFMIWVVSELMLLPRAHAHDLWINGKRSPAGEWCCGAEDCGIVDPKAVQITAGGYSLRGSVTYGEAVTGNAADGVTRSERINETAPYSEALPSPDGAYWRCKRPDGSRRCLFAPPPGS